MNRMPHWLITIILMVIFIGFQNCATLTHPLDHSTDISRAPRLEEKMGVKLDTIQRGLVRVWALASDYDLIAPQERATHKIFGQEGEDRYHEALAFARMECDQKISPSIKTERVYFAIRNRIGSEGYYLLKCGDARAAAIRQISPEKPTEPGEEQTGFVKIRYPELRIESPEKPVLYYKENEFRFLAAKLLIQEQCGGKAENGGIIRQIEFEVFDSRGGSEGLYRYDCSKGLDVAVFRAL